MSKAKSKKQPRRPRRDPCVEALHEFVMAADEVVLAAWKMKKMRNKLLAFLRDDEDGEWVGDSRD